jgi:hypothetical protein
MSIIFVVITARILVYEYHLKRRGNVKYKAQRKQVPSIYLKPLIILMQ